MRGANELGDRFKTAELETSPHAWSKLRHDVVAFSVIRNISTCVEQTRFHRTEDRQ